MPFNSESAARPFDLTGKVIAERYQVEELLGEGGMGAVYKARHVHMHKAVAIKVLHREMTLNDEARLRFEREAVASARIDHPHVTAATDFGKLEDGTCYLVLDYVSGQSLKNVLATEPRLSPGRAIHIVRQIASALDAAHVAGVIHRDLKPENVMLIEHKGEADFVKVLDFGIAKLQSQNSGNTVQLTQAGAVCGTPAYMSPEQAAGNVVDGRADLYTIGIMLYEMLTGSTPFHGETIVSVLTQHLTVEAPELPASVPLALRRIVKKLLQKDPELRFQTAAELLEALDAVEEPQTAHTIPAPALTPAPGANGSAEARTSGGFTRALRRLGQTPLGVGRRHVPLWQLALACLALGVVSTLLLWPSQPDPRRPASAPVPGATVSAKEGAQAARSEPPRAPRSPPLDLGAARAGDAAALAALEAVAPAKRTAAQWAGLLVGQLRVAKPEQSLATLEAALAAQRPLAEQPEVLPAVAALALHESTSERALRLLGEHFGARGADLLYAWSKKPPSDVAGPFAPRVQRALESAAERASPALQIALELERAKTCTQFRDLLPRAQTDADERALPTLQKKTARRGCGVFNLGDCFKCLRGSNALGDAIAQAKSRPAPELVTPLRPASPPAE